MIWKRAHVLAVVPALLIGCNGGGATSAERPADDQAGSGNASSAGAADDGSQADSSTRPFAPEEIATFDEPWAMEFLPGGKQMLITTKPGKLYVLTLADKSLHEVTGLPRVDYGGQGGLGDVVNAPDPDPGDKVHPIYLSWVEAGSGDTRGAVLGHADLVINTMAENAFALTNLKVIWRQDPKVTGRGHYSHRVAVAPDSKHIFLASGERQKFKPAQDMTMNLGKVLRLNPDGSVPTDNPFADLGGVAAQFWSTGHRNVLGLTFDGKGRLWAAEMGPKGGDEVNLVQAHGNYGWPNASNGSHYDGADIPDHKADDGFVAPKAWWDPSISPSSIAWYDGSLFPDWKGSLFVGALSGEALIRLKVDGDRLTKADRWPMKRIRAVKQGPDGALWLLEDEKGAKLLRLVPAR